MAGRIKLTQTRVERATTPPTGHRILWDAEQRRLRLRLRAGGSKRYIVQFEDQGRTVRRTLGGALLMPVEEARGKATDVMRGVRGGTELVSPDVTGVVSPSFLPTYLSMKLSRFTKA